VVATHHLLEQHNLVSKFRISKPRLMTFLSKMQEGYRNANPYHNVVHALDVLINMNYFLNQARPSLGKGAHPSFPLPLPPTPTPPSPGPTPPSPGPNRPPHGCCDPRGTPTPAEPPPPPPPPPPPLPPLQENLKRLMSPLDVLACLLAAAIHDFRHPGFNQNFLVATKHELAILYSDQSVLESMHVSSAWAILLVDDCTF